MRRTQVQEQWQRKVQEAERRVFEMDKELSSYKNALFADPGPEDAADAYGGDDVREQAARDAAGFGASIYADGSMVVPSSWQDLHVGGGGGASSEGGAGAARAQRPVASMDDGRMHVFVDGEQAVLLQSGAEGLRDTLVGAKEDLEQADAHSDLIARAAKMGCV